MSVTYISAELRRLVAERASRRCEYCLIHETDAFFGCEVDHIISEKHDGPTQADNLAYACFSCNRNKGSDIASLVPGTEKVVRLFHPRRDRWRDYFQLEADNITIEALTEVGEVTSRILAINVPDRLLERQALVLADRYPPDVAKQ